MEPPKLLTDLPADALQHVLVRLTLAHNIGRAAPTCRALDAAAKLALKLRPFSGKIVTLAGSTWSELYKPSGAIGSLRSVAAAPDGL